jgi:hypothetical protein
MGPAIRIHIMHLQFIPYFLHHDTSLPPLFNYRRNVSSRAKIMSLRSIKYVQNSTQEKVHIKCNLMFVDG